MNTTTLQDIYHKLTVTVTDGSSDTVLARPGLSIILFYDFKFEKLCPKVAHMFELFTNFIAPVKLENYLAYSGYKKLTPRALKEQIRLLNIVHGPPGIGCQFSFNQGDPYDIGTHGFHFMGLQADDKYFPKASSMLVLEFPLDFLDTKTPGHFVDFVMEIANTIPFISGQAGHAFHFKPACNSGAPRRINRFLPRYLGFDPCFEGMKDDMQGHTPSPHWLNILNSDLVEQLGGEAYIRGCLPPAVKVHPLNNGLLIRASKLPPIGDVNRGARDIGYLPDVARLLKPTRIRLTGIGTPDDDAKAWLSRFDELESIPEE